MEVFIMMDHKTKFRLLIFFLLLIVEASPEQAPGEAAESRVKNSWDKVAELYLPSLTQEQPTLAPNTVTAKKDSFMIALEPQTEKVEDKKPSDRLQEILTPTQKTNRNFTEKLLNHMAIHSTNIHEESQAFMDDTTYRDLAVFSGNEVHRSASLFNIIDQTQTRAGRAALLDILYNPLTDHQALIDRQQAIKMLVDNDSLFTSLQEKLTAIKDAEQILFELLTVYPYSDGYGNYTYSDKISSYNKNFQVTNPLHFGNLSFKFFNKVLQLVMPALPFLPQDPIYQAMAAEITSSMILNGMNAGISKIPFFKKLETSLADKMNSSPNMLGLQGGYNFFNRFFISPFLALRGYAQSAKNIYHTIKNKNISSHKLLFGVSGANLFIGAPFNTYHSYKALPYIHDEALVKQYLYEAMCAFSKFVKTLRDLQKLVADNKPLATIIAFDDFEKNASADLKKFIVLMDDDFFGKKTIGQFNMVDQGKMAAAIYLASKVKCELTAPYIQAGSIDALVSTATLYKSLEDNTNARYQFAEYEEQQATPHIKFDSLWNPFISADTVVTNSFELGTETGHRNMLITGPNAGGKSTILKAIALSILMAQTLTIAPGNISLTPFKKVFSTLNIVDTVGEESLFQAEKKRIGCVLTALKELQSNEFALLICDELFNSTGAAHGAALLGGTLSFIDTKLRHTLFTIATHFEDLTQLEEKTNGSIANFRVEEAKTDKDGKICWTYKIQPGINRQNIAFKLVEEDGFDAQIIQESKDLLNRWSPPVTPT